MLQRRDLSGALTADRLHSNATPRERESDPRTVAAAARKQLYSKFPVCPARCHAREGPQNAAERSWWCRLCDTTPAPHTVHCHGLPSRIRKPWTCHLAKFEHSLLPTALLPLPSPEAGGRECGAAQASKQVTDAIVTPKNKGGEWTADAPSPIIFLSLSDAGLSSWKGIALAALAVFLLKDRPISFVTDYTREAPGSYRGSRHSRPCPCRLSCAAVVAEGREVEVGMAAEDLVGGSCHRSPRHAQRCHAHGKLFHV